MIICVSWFVHGKYGLCVFSQLPCEGLEHSHYSEALLNMVLNTQPLTSEEAYIFGHVIERKLERVISSYIFICLNCSCFIIIHQVKNMKQCCWKTRLRCTWSWQFVPLDPQTSVPTDVYPWMISGVRVIASSHTVSICLCTISNNPLC
jgi:hypothetical protein